MIHMRLIRLTPGIFGDSSRGANGILRRFNSPGPGGSSNSIFQAENQPQIGANGQRVSANNFQIDGVSVNSLSHGGAAVVTPNQESVKEIQISSSSLFSRRRSKFRRTNPKLFHRMGLTIFTAAPSSSTTVRSSMPLISIQTILVVAEQNVSSASSGSLVAVSVDHSFCRGSVASPAAYNLRDRAFFFCLTKRYVRTQPRRRLLTSRHRSSGKPSSMHGPEESAPGYWPATAFNPHRRRTDTFMHRS